MLDLLRYVGGPLLAAIIGGVIVHLATRRRDAENERRKQRIEYLVRAYRTLTHSAHRDMSSERAEAFEDALSDVVLFGNADQIRLAREVIEALAGGGTAPLDALLVSFRTALRDELDLDEDDLRQVPVVRFGFRHDHPALTVQDSWSVRRDKIEASFAAAFAATATGTASAHDPTVQTAHFTGVAELRELAQVAPGAAVVSSYSQVRSALATLLNVETSDVRDAPELARSAAARSLIAREAVETIEGLAVLKDLSRRGGAGTGLDPEKANEYVDLAAAMLYIISRSRPGQQAS